MICTFCGDPAVGLCTRQHRQWTIVNPSEILAGDILMRPDGAIYAVMKVVPIRGADEFRIFTRQKRTFLLLYPELPVLVKRDVLCGWPRCELHCGKCMNYREEEDTRAELLQSANAVNPQKAKEREEEHQHKVTPIRRKQSKQRSIPQERTLR